MKTTNQVLSILAALSLSACQAGKITSESSTLKAQGSAVTNTTISVLNTTPGNALVVDLNPTSSSTVSTVPTSSAARISSSTVAAISSPTPTTPVVLPDKYEIFYASQLATQLSQLTTYQNLYQNYMASLVSNASTPVPAALLANVSLTITTYNAKTATLNLRVIDFLDPSGAVITFGNGAWYGSALLPASTSSAAVLLSTFSDIKFVKYGSGLFAIGGAVSTGALNRNVSNIAFYAASSATSPATFAVSPSAIATLTSPDCHISSITSAAVSSALKTAVNTANSTVGAALTANKTVFVGYANSVGAINSIYRYDLPSGSPVLVSAVGSAGYSTICSAIVGSFLGSYTCATAAPTSACPAPSTSAVNVN